jgi:hypothetical protein
MWGPSGLKFKTICKLFSRKSLSKTALRSGGSKLPTTPARVDSFLREQLPDYFALPPFAATTYSEWTFTSVMR